MDRKELDRYISILSACPLFNGMGLNSLADLPIIMHGEVFQAQAKEELNSSYLYIVLDGSVNIEKIASDGRSINMSTALPGSAVNAASVLCPDADLSRLYAQKKSIILRADEQSIRDTLENGGRFAVNYMEFLVDRICFLNSKIASFTGYSTESRLTHYLKEHEINGTVTIPSSLSNFAGLLGSGRASLYRAIEHMETEGLIVREGKTIRITGDL